MANKIIASGYWQLWRAQKRLSFESLHKKYAKELASATPEQKQEILDRMLREFDRQKNHKPSAGSLW